MKRFHFSLEAVATIRRHQEQLALDHYHQTAEAHRQEERALVAVRTELEGVMANRRSLRPMAAGEWAQQQTWQQVLEQKALDQSGRVVSAKRLMDEAAIALREARQRREMVEKVREGRRARFDAEVRRLEQKALDELVPRGGLAQSLLETGTSGSPGNPG